MGFTLSVRMGECNNVRILECQNMGVSEDCMLIGRTISHDLTQPIFILTF